MITSDYASLLITRWYLGVIKKHPGRAILLLVGDFISSLLWTACFFLVWFAAFQTLREFWIGSLDVPAAIVKQMILSCFSTITQYVKSFNIGYFYFFVRNRGGPITVNSMAIFCITSLATSIPLWLTVLLGFLLKGANRFDLIFDWFTSKFDIEKKPLSAIGLVAGSLVAILYWSWAAFRHFYPAAP
jgi:hypothetical protein